MPMTSTSRSGRISWGRFCTPWRRRSVSSRSPVHRFMAVPAVLSITRPRKALSTSSGAPSTVSREKAFHRFVGEAGVALALRPAEGEQLVARLAAAGLTRAKATSPTATRRGASVAAVAGAGGEGQRATAAMPATRITRLGPSKPGEQDDQQDAAEAGADEVGGVQPAHVAREAGEGEADHAPSAHERHRDQHGDGHQGQHPAGRTAPG